MWRTMLKSASVLVHIHNDSERLDVFDVSEAVRPETLFCRLWLFEFLLPPDGLQPVCSLWPLTFINKVCSPMHMDIFIILCKPWTLLWSEGPAAHLETQQPPAPRSKSLGSPSISCCCLLNADWLFKQRKIELCKLAGASTSVWANNVSWTGKKKTKKTQVKSHPSQSSFHITNQGGFGRIRTLCFPVISEHV